MFSVVMCCMFVLYDMEKKLDDRLKAKFGFPVEVGRNNTIPSHFTLGAQSGARH